MRRLGAAGLLMLAAACGGANSSLTGPSALEVAAPDAAEPARLQAAGAARVGLSVVSGETGAPVAGAELRVDGQVAVTDAAGSALTATAGSRVEVRAAGFLLRETKVPVDGRISLWPDRAGLDAALTRDLMHVHGHLVRATALVIDVAGLDPEAVAAHEWAAGQLTAATGGRIPVSVTRNAPSGTPGLVRASINGADTVFVESPKAWAYARPSVLGTVAMGGDLVYRHAEAARLRCLVLHELGHHLGLGHSPQPGIMSPTVQPLADFTPTEKLLLQLAEQRRPGTVFPDNDQAVAARGRSTMVALACGR